MLRTNSTGSTVVTVVGCKPERSGLASRGPLVERETVPVIKALRVYLVPYFVCFTDTLMEH